jgi:hypothetical protein
MVAVNASRRLYGLLKEIIDIHTSDESPATYANAGHLLVFQKAPYGRA